MDGNAAIQEAEAPAGDAPVESGDQNLDSHYSSGEHSHPSPSGAAAPPDFVDPIESLIDASLSDVPSDADPSSTSPLATANESAPNGPQEGPGDFQPFDPFAQIPSMDAPSNPDSTAAQEFANAEFQSIEMNAGPPMELPPSAAEGEEPTSQTSEGPSFGPADDPLNLNEFANSEISSAKDGPLLFRVLISGIDTREIRESIREVLEDSRFAWDSGGIFSKISKGHLAIDGLSPVKASILITRIKRLPVQIRWEQYAITQGQI
jgi:hypothetical protein